MRAIKKIISKNQGVFAASGIIIGIMIWGFGCQSQVTSLTEPSIKVTRGELKIEIDVEITRLERELEILMRQAALKVQDLDRQDEIKQKLFDFAALTVANNALNPAGAVALAFSIFGIGAVIDNRIKDKVIKNRPKVKA